VDDVATTPSTPNPKQAEGAQPVHRLPALVDEPVVAFAQEDAVAQGGVASCDPANHVMGVGVRLPDPGKRHPRSRASRALRRAGGMVRVRRPTSRMEPSGALVTRTTLASHERRRDVSCDRGMHLTGAESPLRWGAHLAAARGWHYTV
jgi:hypothetical protein